MSTQNTAKKQRNPIDRLVATVVNGAEVARFGGLRTEEDPAPFELVAHQPVYRLRHYFADATPGRPPVVLVPPLGQVADVWDISPATSAVRMLHAQGLDPWVVDFGDPHDEPGGRERTFTDHVLAVVDTVRRVRHATGRDVHLGGYCQGGIFSYVAAAYLQSSGVASLWALGSPLKVPAALSMFPDSLMRDLYKAEKEILGRTGMPRWAVQTAFNWMTPHRTVRDDLTFLLALHDRESLLPREPQRKFLKTGAWVSYAAPAFAELVDILADNRFLDGGVVIADRTASLSDITCPILSFVGEADVLAPPAVVRTIGRAAPNADVYEVSLPVGHFGLPISSHAKRKTWPGIAAWVRWIESGAALPEYIVPLATEKSQGDAAPRGRVASVAYGLGLAAQTGLEIPGAVAGFGRRMVSTTIGMSREALAQMPRLVRLESMGPSTTVSYASLLDDLAAASPDRVAFLYADRAHTHADAKRRIDAVVGGLVANGVRNGERVGILMDTRPSALVALAALNRIGAVAVLHRPDEDLGAQVRLARVSTIVADPEHAQAATEIGVPVLALGGAHTERALPAGVVDLEAVDPTRVALPAWYRANPGRAADVAFVLFGGSGATLRADRITNGRWATSALAAGSACALTPRDTVYATSPLHRPAGLLLSTAAAAASGARLALADGFDPQTFWAEVRRYGATVVTYTRDMLAPLVDAEPGVDERNHPIRLFVGSAMPAQVWDGLVERFGPVGVLELYASTRSDAILGNVRGRKVGSVGKPLPGTPKVRVVAMDGGRIRTDENGFAKPVAPGEVGQLLVDASGTVFAGNDIPLRGVFARDDAWMATGDLFRVDADGDLWFDGPVVTGSLAVTEVRRAS